ncbi:MAG: hypothetical protein ABUT20_42135, partial [Bacteroidota bacterium]
PKKNIFTKLTRQEDSLVQNRFVNNERISLQKKENSVYALPVYYLTDIAFIQSALYIKKAGVLVGQLTLSELVPEHELALSTIINTELQAIELTQREAICYLSKGQIDPGEHSGGWTLARYRHHNLGWMKVLSNRINNYYPSAWRILSKPK